MVPEHSSLIAEQNNNIQKVVNQSIVVSEQLYTQPPLLFSWELPHLPLIGQKGDALAGSLQTTVSCHSQRTHNDVPLLHNDTG